MIHRGVFIGLGLSSLILCGEKLGAHDGPHPEAGSVQPVTDGPAEVRITEQGRYRTIVSNGLPSHETGRFPNAGNPNRIAPQRHQYRIPRHPQVARRLTEVRGPFGVGLNGVPFDPGTAEFWQRNARSGWRYEALSGKINLGLDDSNAHVQPTGNYHYHGLPWGLIEQILDGDDSRRMVMVGYALDGFPVYAKYGPQNAEDLRSELIELRSSYRLKRGTRPSGPGGRYDGTFVQDWEFVAEAGALDEANGRRGPTPEYPDGTYYYVLTEDFPFIPRYWRGTPDPSAMRRPPGPPPGGGFGPPGRRRPPVR